MDEANEQPQWYKHPTDSMLEVQDGGAQPQGDPQDAPRCGHPECHTTLGLTLTDLGPLCGVHLAHTKDIVRGEQRLMAAEAELTALRKNAGDYKEALAEIERLWGALKESVEALVTLRSDCIASDDGPILQEPTYVAIVQADQALALPAVRELEGE